MKNLVILGSTGSIGVQALEVVAASGGKLKILGLAAGKNIELLRQQIKKFQPEVVAVKQEQDAVALQKQFPAIKVYAGEDGLIKVATLAEATLVLVAIVGVNALKPTIEAIKLKKDIALASKEILVAAGAIIMNLVKEYGVKLLPVDSEHSAIIQACRPLINKRGFFEYPVEKIEKIILTASGGAFRDLSYEAIKNKKVKEALSHPNWQMGRKITIDSATLMNKGLEVIEAHWLFDLPYEKIEVVIHPQSIIHSLVEFIDGSVLAQMGVPDMRIPIQYAFYYPERIAAKWPKIKLTELEKLTFKNPDTKNFKALKLAYMAGTQGGTTPAVLNAANEEAVNLFLAEKISFFEIADIIEDVLHKHTTTNNPSLEQIIAADNWARVEAKKKLRILK